MMDCLLQIAFIGPGGPEFLVVMLVLLLMFGAKDAPRIFRKINEVINSIRNTADSFKREIMYSDIHSDSPSTADYDEEPHDYDDDYDYGDEIEYDDSDEEAEREYSDETFQNLERDLEGAGLDGVKERPAEAVEPAPEPAEEGDGDAKKA